MDNNEKLRKLLSEITHPETGKDIITSGIVEQIDAAGGKVTVTLNFPRQRDPFANSIKRQVTDAVLRVYPEAAESVGVIVKEGAPVKKQKPEETQSALEGIGKIVAVASGKGGVGKSTVTANLAVTLTKMGYSVGILDADIYGPSQPKMFGIEGHEPQGLGKGDEQWLLPAESQGIKIASIGFFIPQGEALVWRGPMATSALKQLIHQTLWEKLDFLLVDLPPGTGDVHLSIVSELKLDGAVIVSTPQQVAVADVKRGIKMFRSPGVDVPVLGLIENMAWFTPAELPQNRYYIFGHGGARELAKEEKLDFLGDIPIIQSVMEGGENGVPASSADTTAEKHYVEIARKIVEKLS